MPLLVSDKRDGLLSTIGLRGKPVEASRLFQDAMHRNRHLSADRSRALSFLQHFHVCLPMLPDARCQEQALPQCARHLESVFQEVYSVGPDVLSGPLRRLDQLPVCVRRATMDPHGQFVVRLRLPLVVQDALCGQLARLLGGHRRLHVLDMGDTV